MPAVFEDEAGAAPAEHIATLEAFGTAITARVLGEQVRGLSGRVLKGKCEADFSVLSPDPVRKTVFMVGPDGLEAMLGKSGYEILIQLGYLASYIKEQIASGMGFKLVVFPEADGSNGIGPRLATWDGALDLACTTFPELAGKINSQRDTLKQTTFEQIQSMADFDFPQVHNNGMDDPNFMTPERLESLEDAACGIVQVRAFLYNTMAMRALYGGEGYTVTEDGVRGVQEWIAPNMAVDELGEHLLIDLPVELP